MKYKQTITAIAFLMMTLSFSKSTIACCIGQPQTLTEILESDLAIFLCQVDSTYMHPSGGAMSFATVTELFKGDEVPTQVILSTGGNTTAGGRHLKKGNQYLIVSQSRDNRIYGAFVCDNFSREVDFQRKFSRKDGVAVLTLIRQYFDWKQSGYSGKVALKINDVLEAKGTFKDGTLHDKWQHFSQKDYQDKTRIVNSEGNYKNGKKHGQWSYFANHSRRYEYVEVYGNGVLLARENYTEEDKKRYLGSRIAYDGDMQLVTSYFPDGEIKQQYVETKIEMPTRYGNRTYFYKNGNCYSNLRDSSQIEKGTYRQNKKVGEWIYFNPETEEQTTEFFSEETNSAYDFTSYYKEGGQHFTGNFLNNKKHGEWIFYQQKGSIGSKMVFQYGVLDGVVQYFRAKEGTVYKTDFYENGRKLPKSKTYYKDGQTLAFESELDNESKSGLQKHYHENGQLSEIATFKNGEKHGWHYKFSEKGDTLLAAEYFKGYLNGDYFQIGIYKSQEPKTIGQYRRGFKVGDWEYYDESGKLTMIDHFQRADAEELRFGYFNEDKTYFDEKEQEISTEEYWSRKKAEFEQKKTEQGK